MNKAECVRVDGKDLPIEGERNLLELVRKGGIEIPTFCYHSELSVYGACRLCLVDIEGKGVATSCTTEPRPGMAVRTNTAEIREMRRVTIELLLANHDHHCPTCPKSGACQLQDLARRLGMREVRFKPTRKEAPVDVSSPAVARDPNKCVLCGDCVRACTEIQSVGAIGFAHRGADATVVPAFDKDLGRVECVHCGQCARVCPTGALTPRTEVDEVWAALHDPDRVVVAQIAPAVRVGLGERFGLAPGADVAGKIVAALRAVGFDRVYDTPFAADMTVLEEVNEFIGRKEGGGKLPQFTSCCPAWVQFAEQYYPGLLPHLSSCRSPQQMFGALAKSVLPEQLGVAPENLAVVSIMPCTAKKAEARQEKFAPAGRPDVDNVLTTQELARLIDEAGLRFAELESQPFDNPFGFKSGAAVLFGASGGVAEAVVRHAFAQRGEAFPGLDLEPVEGDKGVRQAEVELGGTALRVAVVQGLAAARDMAERVAKGEAEYDLIEVMACPGGCVGGAGQPVRLAGDTRALRAKGLGEADRSQQIRSAGDNFHLAETYRKWLGDVGGDKAHCLLHTTYASRRRIASDEEEPKDEPNSKLPVRVCVGTNCYLRGSLDLLAGLAKTAEQQGCEEQLDIRTTFCFEQCNRGPSVRVDGQVLNRCTLEAAWDAVREALREANRHNTGQPQAALKETKAAERR